MNIKRAKEEIKYAIEAYLYREEDGEYAIPVVGQRPILLIGPPGIGKTQIMEQVARECGVALVSYTITHHTRQSAIGLPFIAKADYEGGEENGPQASELAVTRYTMSEIIDSVYEKMKKTGLKEGILFIDEINCVSETLAPAMLQFLQCKMFGNHRIPEGWTIVAAGNPPEYNKSVREFDIVTLDRVKKINVEADFSVWKEYAHQKRVHPAILSYLNARSGNFCRIETTVDGKYFVTPRGWEDLSRILAVYESLGRQADRELVVQYLQHEAVAKDFSNYLELYYKYEADYRVDEILQGHVSEALFRNLSVAAFDERVSVIGLLISALSGKFRQIWEQENQTEGLLSHLKTFRKLTEMKADEENAAAGIQCYEQMLQSAETAFSNRQKAELADREEIRTTKKQLAVLEAFGQEMKARHQSSVPDCLEFVRAGFEKENERYEELFQNGREALEYAFDFMEEAFSEGQEMVIFLTELNASPYCGHFLAAYDCERYFRYNKKLLFEDREKEILQHLQVAKH